jgi:hypothetical protein
MRRLDLGTGAPNFIGAWQLDKAVLCRDIIDFFERRAAAQKAGRSSYGLDHRIKKSTDLTVNPNDLRDASHHVLVEYFNELHACYADYLQQWPFLKTMLSDVDIGEFNIQRYDPGGHFAATHSERTTLEHAHRVLAWMTYLNDVDDGGETHFLHYGLDVKPERGKTLIWPAEWTHAHSGQVVKSGRKYIITGWMHFPLPVAPATASAA